MSNNEIPYRFKAGGEWWQVVPQVAASINDTMSSRRGEVVGYCAFPYRSQSVAAAHFVWTPKMSQEDLEAAAAAAMAKE